MDDSQNDIVNGTGVVDYYESIQEGNTDAAFSVKNQRDRFVGGSTQEQDLPKDITPHQSNSETQKTFELDDKQKAIMKAIHKSITGKDLVDELPTSKREIIDSLTGSIENELEGHLDKLAHSQGKSLVEMPQLTEESTADDQLNVLRILTANIHSVQNKKMAGITPHLSRELGGMDCSMSTWVMQHEARKAGLDIEWGAPVGHAVGIVTLKDGRMYYADGQGGFVEQIVIDNIPLPDGANIVAINNHSEIQEKHGNFFPKYVFTSEIAGVSATLSNIDSMLYKQYIGEITEEIMHEYGEDALIVKDLQPFARDFQTTSGMSEESEEKRDINDMSQALFPDAVAFRNSDQAKEDFLRLELRNV